MYEPHVNYAKAKWLVREQPYFRPDGEGPYMAPPVTDKSHHPGILVVENKYLDEAIGILRSVATQRVTIKLPDGVHIHQKMVSVDALMAKDFLEKIGVKI